MSWFKNFGRRREGQYYDVDPQNVDNSDIYNSLKIDSRSIRLVRVLAPGELQLKTVSFGSTCHDYKALSYTGENSPQDSVWKCNNMAYFKITRTLDDFFTRCLDQAKSAEKGWRFRDSMKETPQSRFLRITSTSGIPWLWIDQICINQADDEEKKTQIPLMRDIYGSANTIVWLGEGTELIRRTLLPLALYPDDDIEMRGANETAMRRRRDHAKQRRSEQYGLGHIVGEATMEQNLNNRLRQAYQALIELPWFSRTWVVQEVALSSSSLEIACGDLMLSWDKIMALLSNIRMPGILLEGQPDGQDVIFDRTMELSLRYLVQNYPKQCRNLQAFHAVYQPPRTGNDILPKLDEPQQWDLASLLVLTACLDATKSHDKIYGLLGLSTEMTDGNDPILDLLEVDYGQDFPALCRRLTLHFLLTGKFIIWFLLRNGASMQREGWPSWVVDFSATSPDLLLFGQLKQRTLHRGNFALEIDRYPPSPIGPPNKLEVNLDPRVLILRGYRMGVIKSRWPLFHESKGLIPTWTAFSHDCASEYPELEQRAEMLVKAAVMRNNLPHGTHYLVGFYQLMLQHIRQYNIYDPRLQTAFEEALAVYCQRNPTSGFPPLSQPEKMMKPMHDLIKDTSNSLDHAIFWTGDGEKLVGRGPERAWSGDIICSIPGIDYPLVLRPLRDGEEYLLVGPCFIVEEGVYSPNSACQAFHIV